MGLILVPSEVRLVINELKTALTNILAGYHNVATEISDFATDDELRGDTWTKLREKTMEYHFYISQGIGVVEDSVTQALSVLEQSIGDEELYEDELLYILEGLETDKRSLEEELNRYRSLQNSFLDELFGRIIEQCIEQAEEDIETVVELIYIQKEKLEFLYNVEDSTRGLFDAGTQLLFAMGALINEAGININSQPVTKAVRSIVWDALTKTIIQQDKEIDLYIDQILHEEFDIDLEQLKNKYGEECAKFFKDIYAQARENNLEDVEPQKFMIDVLNYITGRTVSKVGNKYQYTNENEEKIELTKRDVKQLLINQLKIEKLISVAYGEVGIKEEGINRVKYNNWYYRGKENLEGTQQTIPEGEAYPWCAVFVCWCANEADMLEDSIPRTEGCARMKELFKAKGAYYSRKESYEPKCGDIFVHLKGDGRGHVGIVIAYDRENEMVYTIEGNNGDKVSLNRRKYDSYFDGFGNCGGMQAGTIPEIYNEPSSKDR